MNRFGANAQEFFDSVYDGAAPWDIGGAQPAMVALLDAFPPQGPVLDVGCGSGDLAVFLARRGLNVVGIDFAAAAIRQAQAKAGSLPIEFIVADALRPTSLGRRFASVVDSGFLHVLTPQQTDDYLQELHAALLPGGRCYLHEFAVEFEIPNTPRQITERELRQRFAPAEGWQILDIRAGEFLSRFAPVPAILACMERL